ncbi:MAG: penicillin-binding protein [Candidatus Hydrogenedentota bacterium]
MTDREHVERQHRQMYGNRPDDGQVLRIRILMTFFLLAFLAVCVRLYFVHLAPTPELLAEQRVHEGMVNLPIPRGKILDANGVVLATDDRAPTLWADPALVPDPAHVARVLSAHLGIPEDTLRTRLRKHTQDGTTRRFAYIERWITDLAPEVLESLIYELGPGVYLRYEPVRYYPQGELAAQVLGFTNRVGTASEGLEYKCDKWLHGVAGVRRARKDAQRNLLASMTLEYKPPQGGHNVVLTIDAAVQETLEHEIDAALERVNAPRGMGMIMDPHTGAILALAVRPSYDPNHYERADPGRRKCRALTDVFEPGSAFKLVVASAALEHGIVTPETEIDCEGGSFNPYGHRIKDVHKLDIATFTTCYAESSNIAHIKIGALLGPERLERWIRRFGFGQRTTRELGSIESPGLVWPRSRWSRLTMGSLPIGQEVGVTLPQLTRAFAVVANGGLLVQPHFVERVETRDGEVIHRTEPDPPQRIISPETAATMRHLNHQVVLHGTGTHANIPAYRAGGKTGTAQIAEPGKGYVPKKYTAVFAGFAPIANPRVVAVIVIEEPEYGTHHGGRVCGPVFRDVVRNALVRMHVPEDPVPDEQDPDTTLAMAQANADADTVTEPLPNTIQQGDAPEDEPVILDPLDDLELIEREQDGTEWVRGLPDFTGMTMREARARLLDLGIPWDPQGAGRVAQQRPAPGTPVTRVDVCRLFFAHETAEANYEQSTVM